MDHNIVDLHAKIKVKLKMEQLNTHLTLEQDVLHIFMTMD